MNLGYEPEDLKIYIFSVPIDMRKQMNGLLALVEGAYGLDAYTKVLFVFTNKKKDKIKALKWDDVYFTPLDHFARYFRPLVSQPESNTLTGCFPGSYHI